MHAQNTLELARQGDPAAIATILSYHLSQRYNTTASVIRLGDYLSVLIDTAFAADQAMLCHLVLTILKDLQLADIATIEVSGRRIGDQEVLWSQTIDLTDLDTNSLAMNDESLTTNEAESWDATVKKLLQRPEMVALVAFALLLVLWDTYAEWMAEMDPAQPLSGVKLARRLGISSRTLNRYKTRTNFSEWSQDLDPDGVAWMYEGKGFVPKLP